jgi:hypothetical protein
VCEERIVLYHHRIAILSEVMFGFRAAISLGPYRLVDEEPPPKHVYGVTPLRLASSF